MKKIIFKITLATLVFSSLTFTACKKDSEVEPEEVAVEDNNSGLTESEDLVSISDDVFTEYQNSQAKRISAGGQTYYGATVTFTFQPESNAGTVSIDFGTSGLKGRDGRTRKGKINIAFSNVWLSSGSTRDFTFDNYYVNGNKVEGTKTVTVSVSKQEGVRLTSINSSLKITTAAGKIITWTSNRNRVYNTKNTADLSDDEVSLTGTVTGVNRNGTAYAASITSALVFKASCVSASGWMPVSGVLEVTPEGGVKRTVNYGTGDCDRVVNVTVGAKSFDVTVK